MEPVSVLRRFAWYALLGAAACAAAVSVAARGASEESGRYVAATTSIVGDIVRQVSDGQIAVRVLLPPGADAHIFEPTPADARRLAAAALVFANGAGLEGGSLRALLQNVASASVVELAATGPRIPLRAAADTERHAGSERDEWDPHLWLDPTIVAEWAERVGEELAGIDPTHAAHYRSRGAALATELRGLDRWAMGQLARVPPARRVLLADHQVFAYFAARYGFELRQAIVPGPTTAAEPSARRLAELRDLLAAEGVPAVFVGPGRTAALAHALVEGLDIAVVEVHTSSLGGGACPAPRYQELMRCNVNAIVTALR